MAEEKNFENRVKRFLESVGIYSLGTPPDKMKVEPVGYWEKRWGGGIYTKSGLPDMHVSVKGTDVEVELKAENGIVSELQKFVIMQMTNCGTIALILHPSEFGYFKKLIFELIRKDD